MEIKIPREKNRHIRASDIEIIKINVKITTIYFFMSKDLKEKN